MIEIASTDKDRPKSGIGGAAFNLVNSIGKYSPLQF